MPKFWPENVTWIVLSIYAARLLTRFSRYRSTNTCAFTSAKVQILTRSSELQLRDEVQIHVVESKNVRCSEGGSLEEVIYIYINVGFRIDCRSIVLHRFMSSKGYYGTEYKI